VVASGWDQGFSSGSLAGRRETGGSGAAEVERGSGSQRMGGKKRSTPASGETKREGKASGRRRRKDKAALVEQVIENLEKRLKNDELKATVGDLIRLVQLEKELEEERPKEIKVTWVEPEQGNG